MGYDTGWAALNMEMPPVMPRTEYSVQGHWELISRMTGQDITPDSPSDVRHAGSCALMKAWDLSFGWSTLINSSFLTGPKTSMGHAVYAAGGVDRDDDISCPFLDEEDVLNFDPVVAYGMIDKATVQKKFEEHYANNCRGYDDIVNMSGIYISLFSGLIDIFGWEMLLAGAGTDAKRFGEMARRYETWIAPFFEAFANSSVPVMMSHDDICWTSGPVLAPAWYREFIFPAYKRLWRPVLDSGKRLVFTSDGTYDMFFDDIVACGAHALVMEPGNDMAGFAEKYGKTHGFIGNADTRILLTGSREAIEAEVKRCTDIGRNCPGFIMAVGNHIPANTPVESCLWYDECYKKMRVR